MDSGTRFAALGYQQLTSITVSTALTVPAGATCALITAEAQNARWRDDGTAPTASVGQLMKTTDSPLFYTGNLSAFRLINATGGTIVNVSYYSVAG